MRLRPLLLARAPTPARKKTVTVHYDGHLRLVLPILNYLGEAKVSNLDPPLTGNEKILVIAFGCHGENRNRPDEIGLTWTNIFYTGLNVEGIALMFSRPIRTLGPTFYVNGPKIICFKFMPSNAAGKEEEGEVVLQLLKLESKRRSLFSDEVWIFWSRPPSFVERSHWQIMRTNTSPRNAPRVSDHGRPR